MAEVIMIKMMRMLVLPIRYQIGRTRMIMYLCIYDIFAYLIFVIFFTQAKFVENKIYTEKRQFFTLNL